MNTAEAEELLKRYLLRGVGAQIAYADLSYALAEEIGEHSDRLNEASFGELFGLFQVMLSDRQTLEATKLFDSAKGYPTRSIPGTLKLLKDHAPLWRIRERWKLAEVLAQGGADTSGLGQLSDEALTHAVVKHYRNTLPSAHTLRKSRDKVIAHNEDIIPPAALKAPTWGEALDLIDYAKGFVITIGYGYLGLLFGAHSADYIPTTQAVRPARALRRLLEQAGIVEGRNR